ncbi:MAG: hypothetical protein LBJ84_06770 [Oscillospiraceae bacterium]|jgi:hypothetical protein|nr:hypothetical protein [Oscillospiraceae bacterium]
MAFIPAKETKNEHPLEFYTADAGVYQAGQIVQLSGGAIKALSAAMTTTPQFICKSSIEIKSPPVDINGGKVLVMPFDTDADEEYYAPLAAAAAQNYAVGALLSISADGLSIAATSGKVLLLEPVKSGAPAGTYVCVKFAR